MRDLPLFILLVIIVAGLYLRFDQPQEWDNLLASCQTPAAKAQAVEQAADLAAATAKPRPAPVAVAPVMPATPVVETPAPAPTPAPTVAPPKLWAAPDPLPAQANWTWTTSKGVTYTNVVVKRVEPSTATILDDSGGARVTIADLPPDIQKQLNYDPEAAKVSEAEAAAAQVILDNEKLARKQREAAMPPPAPVVTELSQGQKEQIQDEILQLKKDINSKLRQIASAYYTGDGYAHAVSSQSTYRDAVMDEAAQINTLEDRLGQSHSGYPVFYPTYPYYYYPY